MYLGGNDLREQTDLQTVYKQSKDFYALVRDKFPKVKIVASQVESRYLQQTNRFGTPPELEYSKLANYFNRNLKKVPNKDKIFIVKGSNKLSNPSYYSADGIHLNNSGLAKFSSLLRDFLVHYCQQLRE